MSRTNTRRPLHFSLILAMGLLPVPALAHEAWLLTPGEITELASAPIPALFLNRWALGLAAAAGATAILAALLLEDVYRPFEERLIAPLRRRLADLGPLILRLSLGVMVALSGLGGLPRHGTEAWSAPTLLVPDMQLGLIPGWDWLGQVELLMALLLLSGLLVRLAALGLIGLSLLGVALFGPDYWTYTLHFAAPGLLLAVMGAGTASLDRWFGLDRVPALPQAASDIAWKAARILVGLGFVYLGLVYKLMQPTLVIAIIQHAEMPTFGLPYALVALVMMVVEITCGMLLVMGRLVRPVSLVVIGAMGFLAVVLGETPLFHANLIGILLVFAIGGAGPELRLPAQRDLRGAPA